MTFWNFSRNKWFICACCGWQWTSKEVVHEEWFHIWKWWTIMASSVFGSAPKASSVDQSSHNIWLVVCLLTSTVWSRYFLLGIMFMLNCRIWCYVIVIVEEIHGEKERGVSSLKGVLHLRYQMSSSHWSTKCFFICFQKYIRLPFWQKHCCLKYHCCNVKTPLTKYIAMAKAFSNYCY